MFHVLCSESVFEWLLDSLDEHMGGLQPVEGEKSEVSGWPNGSYFLFACNMAKCTLITNILMSCLDWETLNWDHMREHARKPDEQKASKRKHGDKVTP